MKIVCFILLVTFCVCGKAEDPPKPPAPAATPAAGAPAAGAPAAGAPAAGAPAAGAPAAGAPEALKQGAAGLPAMAAAMPGMASLTNALTPAKGSGSPSGIAGGIEVAKDTVMTWINTGLDLAKAVIGKPK